MINVELSRNRDSLLRRPITRYVSSWTDNMRFSVYGRRKPFLFYAALLAPFIIFLAYTPPPFWTGNFKDAGKMAAVNGAW